MTFNTTINRSTFLTILLFLLGTIAFSFSLDVSPRRIDENISEGDRPSTRDITVRNVSSERVHYSVSARENWISVQPVRGTLSPNRTYRHQVEFTTRHLREGTHTGFIEVRSQAFPQPIEVEVTLTIDEKVEINISPGVIDRTIFPGERDPQTSLTISSSSNRSTNYQISTDVGWLRVSPSSGNVHRGRQQRHRVDINTQQMRHGRHEGRITVRAPDAVNSPVTIPVRIEVEEEAVLEVSPHFLRHRLRHGERLRDDTLTLRNTGRQNLSYRARTDAHWIDIYPEQGRIGGHQTHRLDIEYRIGGLQPGVHRARISIESPDIRRQRIEIPVEIEISHRDVVRVEPRELRLSARGDMDRGRYTISLRNLSHEYVDYNIRNHMPWMTFRPTRGWILPNRSEEIEITFQLSTMHYGQNQGYFEVDIPTHYEDPIRVPVLIERREP